MKITIIKKAEVKKSDISICPFIIEGLPEPRK
jgi:hypothetical protein